VTHRKAIVLPTWLVGVVAEGDAPALPAIGAGAPATHEPARPASQRPESAAGEMERDRHQFQEILAHLADRLRAQHAQDRPPLDALRILAVELGVAIAGRLIHEKIAADAYGIEDIVHGALDRLHVKHGATVLLHPDDLALLERRLGGDLGTLCTDQRVQFRADAVLARGACKVQAGDVSVWSSLQAQLREVRDMLLEGLPMGNQSS
jgi:flagellar biosynthesis/type III secretory pathway protein FliH